MTSITRQPRNRFVRGQKEQSHRAAEGARARRNGRWTGHRPLADCVREARLRAISDISEVFP